MNQITTAIRFGVVITLLTFVAVLTGCGISPVDNQKLSTSYSDVGGAMALEHDHWIDFSLPNSEGKLVQLSNVLKEQHVLLMFYRGEWCPYCIDQLGSIEEVLPQLSKYNVKVVAVSADPVAALDNTKKQFGQDYLFLSDSNLQVTKQYGIGNAQDLPHPAVFLINKKTASEDAELLWYFVSSDYKKRPNGQQLLSKVQTLLKNN